MILASNISSQSDWITYESYSEWCYFHSDLQLMWSQPSRLVPKNYKSPNSPTLSALHPKVHLFLLDSLTSVTPSSCWARSPSLNPYHCVAASCDTNRDDFPPRPLNGQSHIQLLVGTTWKVWSVSLLVWWLCVGPRSNSSQQLGPIVRNTDLYVNLTFHVCRTYANLCVLLQATPLSW